MVKTLSLLAALAALASAQATRPPDNPQNVRTGQVTRPAGAGVCWDTFGLLTSVGCTGSGGGEVNTGSNLGSGANVFSGKVLVDLRFRSLVAGSNRLGITQNTNDISLDIIPANMTLSTIGGLLNVTQINASGTPSGSTFLRGDGAWVNVSGGGGGPATTDDLPEGTTNFYHTTSRARNALSASGIVTYNSSTGVISCPNCVSTGSTYADPAWITGLAWSKITGAPTFQLTSEKGSANGYAGLNSSSLVPVANLGTGTANSTTFLRGDGTWTNPAGTVNVLVEASSIGTRAGLNFIANPGISISGIDDGPNNRVNITLSPETSVTATRTRVTQGDDQSCIPTSGSGTAYTCVPASGTAYPSEGGPAPYPNGARIMFRPDVNCGASPTLNISSIGARRLYAADGTSDPTCTAGQSYLLVQNDSLDSGAGGWVFPASGGSSLPDQSGQSGNFLGTDGTTASWTVPMFRQLPAPPTSWTSYNAGGLTINTSLPGRTVLSSTTDATQGVYKAISGNFDQIFAIYTIQRGGADNYVGGFLTDGTRISSCGIAWSTGNSAFQWSAFNLTNATTFSGNISITSAGIINTAGGMGANGQRLVYLRFLNDGTNTSCQYSPDGYEWQVVWTRASGTFLTPTGAGIMLQPQNASGVLTKAIIMGAN